MISTGGRKRMFSGGWIVAALIVAAINGLAMSSLFSPPIVGQSKDARLASQKWLRLETKIAAQVNQSVEHVDVTPVLKRFSPDWPAIEIKKPVAAPSLTSGDVVEEKKLVPPTLMGIMEVTDAQGRRHLSAMMEGRQWAEKTRIRGFYVKKITLEGVELTHSGQQWFIPAPKVYFMQDQSG
ncbi:MAG: hypothetical protein ABIL58_10065 [Pseudomonadota bacterium]